MRNQSLYCETVRYYGKYVQLTSFSFIMSATKFRSPFLKCQMHLIYCPEDVKTSIFIGPFNLPADITGILCCQGISQTQSYYHIPKVNMDEEGESVHMVGGH